jgi:hypothetical protein
MWREAKKFFKQFISFLKWLVLITPPEKVVVPERETIKESLDKQNADGVIDFYYSEVLSKVDYDLTCSDGLDTKAS